MKSYIKKLIYFLPSVLILTGMFLSPAYASIPIDIGGSSSGNSQITPTNADNPNQCTCDAGLVYDSSSNSCKVSNPTNCTERGIRVNCSCPSPLQYNKVSQKCEPPAPSCNSVTGTQDCSCIAGFIAQNGKCVLNASPACNVGTAPKDGSVSLQSPFGKTFDNVLYSITSRATLVFFFIVGLVLFGLIVYAGFLYATDGGNEENAKKAKKVLTSAVIGLAIIAFTGAIIGLIEGLFRINLGI